MLRLSPALMATVALGFLSNAALAIPITSSFSGGIIQVGPDLEASGIFSVSQGFTGTFTYESDAAWVIPSWGGSGDLATRGYLDDPISDFEITVGSYQFGLGTSSMIEVMSGINPGDVERRIVINVREPYGVPVDAFLPRSAFVVMYFNSPMTDTYLSTGTSRFLDLSRMVFFVDWTDVDQANFNRITGEMDLDSVEFASVPEPGSLALLSLGLVGLGFSRRRKLN